MEVDRRRHIYDNRGREWSEVRIGFAKAVAVIGRFLGVALGIIVVAVIALFILSAFADESRWECPGTLTSPDGERKTTLYVRLELWPSVVSLWSDSHGGLRVEIPNEWHSHFSHLRKNGDMVFVAREAGQLHGMLSMLSGNLALSLHPELFFDGACKRIKEEK